MTRPPANPLQVYWVDAFTRDRFRGNAAVVVPQAEGLTAEQMQLIAREVNCSETAFISPATVPGADMRLRWFTPKIEVDLCGHATVAALHVLISTGVIKTSLESLQIMHLQTRSGVLPVTIDTTDPEASWIWLSLPPCQFQPLSQEQGRGLQASLGLSSQVEPEPVVDSLNRDVLVAVDSLSSLSDLQPDFTSLGHLASQQGWRGICVYSQDTLEVDSVAHLRFFAPHCGITEDPVTGSVSVPLVSFLQQKGQLEGFAMPVTLEQGDGLGRSGRVRVDLTEQPQLGGQAITVMRGELYL